MKKTVLVFFVLFVIRPLFAGGDFLWLVVPNWDSGPDLHEYLGGLEDLGYYGYGDADVDDDSQDAAFVLSNLLFEMDADDPDDNSDVDDSVDAAPSITLLDFTLNAFDPDFWVQHLAEIRLLLQATPGWGEDLFCELLIHLIQEAPNDDHVYVFTLYYLQLMQERLGDDGSMSVYVTTIQRLVTCDLRNERLDSRVFYQRLSSALSFLVSELEAKIEDVHFAHAFRAHGDGLIREFFAQVCPNKRKRGCSGGASISLLNLKQHLAKILRVIESAICPFPPLEALERVYEELISREEEGDVLCLLNLELRRAQVASQLSIFHSIRIIVSRDKIKNAGLSTVATESVRSKCRVDDSRSLLRLTFLKDKTERMSALNVLKNGKHNIERARSRNKKSTEQAEQKELERESMLKVLQKEREMAGHWQCACRLLGVGNGPNSEDGTEILDNESDGSTVIVVDESEDEDEQQRLTKRRRLKYEEVEEDD